LSNLTEETCSVQHYTLYWKERTTGAQFTVESWPERLALAPHGLLEETVLVREWNIDRTYPPKVEIPALHCQP
jgi:hypothetical protein